MKATLFSILLAIVLWFIPLEGGLNEIEKASLLVFPAILLLVLPLAYALAWSPLQNGEQNLTPRLFEMYLRDKRLAYTAGAIFLFPLASIVIYILLNHASHVDSHYLLLGWLILFGIALDFGRIFLRRITSYLNPFEAAEIFTKDAKKNILLDEVDLVIDSIDALSEVSIRALERSNTSLATHGIIELKEIGGSFLKSAKGFAVLNEELKNIEEKHIDKTSYTLFYLLGRLEMINQKAVQKKFEPVSSQVLTSLGRIAISAANYDLSLVIYPLLALGRSTILGQENGLKECGVKGEIIFLEIAKAIIKDCDLTYADLKSPFFTLADNMDKVSKEMFRQDKDINIQTLTQPFLQLKEIMNDPKVAEHQDTPAIRGEIDRILSEFVALQTVMSTLPTLPLSE